MGRASTKAIKARRRQADARLRQLIKEAASHDPGAVRRALDLRNAVRRGQWKLRALAPARTSVSHVEAAVGEAILAITDLGLSRYEAFALLRITRGRVRRYVECAAFMDPKSDRFSTACNGDHSNSRECSDGRR